MESRETRVWKNVKRARKKKKKKSRGPITTQSKYNNNKHKMLVFYKIRKKYNEIQLTKNKMDLNNRKMKNRRPSHHYNLLAHMLAGRLCLQ